MKNKKGFVALVIVLFVSGTLLALSFSSAIETALFFDQALRKEYRAMNYYYAQDCLDQAILALAHDYFFEPTSPVMIPEYHCSVLSIEKNGNLRTISTVGHFMNAKVYRQATVKLHTHNLEIVSTN